MNTEEIKETLFKLDDFCKANKIEYAVTGTAALSMLGIPSCFTPQDIDIKVFNLTEEQVEKLKELQFLSCLNNEKYDCSQCFSFTIGHVKINAIVSNAKECNEIHNQSVTIRLIDKRQEKHYFINVQLVKFALDAKMKLYRDKDKAYLLNVIHNLTLLC